MLHFPKTTCLLLIALLSILTHAQEIDISKSVALFEQGQESHGSGKLDLAIEFYEKALSINPEFPEAEFQKATAHFQLKEYDMAEQSYRRTIELKPSWSNPYISLGNLLLKTERWKEAEDLFNKTLEFEPANSSLWVSKALAAERAGNMRMATESLSQAIRLSPEKRDVQLRLANLYAKQGERGKAIEILESLAAVRKDPEVVQSLVELLGTDNKRSIELLKASVDLDPSNAELLAQLGGALRTSDPVASAQYFQRALEISPQRVDYLTGYGAALVQTRRFPEAIITLERVIAVAPENYPAHANLATAYYEQNRFREAIDEYRWILKTRPELSITHFFLATAYDQIKEYDSALESYNKFLESAEPTRFELEKEKVRLRLPSLQKQIKSKKK
jgi:tetratricopeptide (TPR) repeat protein